MLNISKKPKNKVDYILRCNVAKSWAKFDPNCQFFSKREYFGKIKYYIYLLIAPHHVS